MNEYSDEQKRSNSEATKPVQQRAKAFMVNSDDQRDSGEYPNHRASLIMIHNVTHWFKE